MTTYLHVSLCTLIAALSLFCVGGLWSALDLAEQLAAAHQQTKVWQSLALHAPENNAASTPADTCGIPVACAFVGIQLLPEPIWLDQTVSDASAVVEVQGSSDDALPRELQEGRLIETVNPVRGLIF